MQCVRFSECKEVIICMCMCRIEQVCMNVYKCLNVCVDSID